MSLENYRKGNGISAEIGFVEDAFELLLRKTGPDKIAQAPVVLAHDLEMTPELYSETRPQTILEPVDVFPVIRFAPGILHILRYGIAYERGSLDENTETVIAEPRPPLDIDRQLEISQAESLRVGFARYGSLPALDMEKKFRLD